MDIKCITKKQFKEITTKYNVLKSEKVYQKDGDVYKILKSHFNDYTRYGFGCDFFDDQFDVEQIEKLASLRDTIKHTKMVRELIRCKNTYIGIIYDYFAGYNEFASLWQEDKEIIYQNLKSLITNCNELISYGVYHEDLHDQNILYKGTDVQIIDIDGKYISFNDNNISEVYYQVYETIIKIIYRKLLSQYSPEEVRLMMKEVIKSFGPCHFITEMSYKNIEQIEGLRLIK